MIEFDVLVKQLLFGLLLGFETFLGVLVIYLLIEGRRKRNYIMLFSGVAAIGTILVVFPFVLVILGVPELEIANWHVFTPIIGCVMVICAGPAAIRLYRRTRDDRKDWMS